MKCYNEPFWILSILVPHTDQVSNNYLLLFFDCCVGYPAPIDFVPGALTHLLATTKLIVQQTLDIFSRQYLLPTHVNADTLSERKSLETDLKSEILPQLDVTLMALSPVERHLEKFCYINHSEATVPQVTGSLSAATP